MRRHSLSLRPRTFPSATPYLDTFSVYVVNVLQSSVRA
jgi:hypothetical protein